MGYGACKRLRQNLLDVADWWQTVILVVLGHLGKLTSVQRASRPEWLETRDRLKELFSALGPVLADDFNEGSEEVLAEIDLRFSAPRLLKLQGLFQSNRADAERFLSSMIKPKLPLALGLRDPETGEELPLAAGLDNIERDVLQRARKAEQGNDKHTEAVSDFIKQYRVQTLKDTLQDEAEFASLDMVRTCCQQLKPAKASVRLPRASLRTKADAAVVTTWALVNMLATLCLIPGSWFREISPIRKKGPVVVNDLTNLRPVAYTCPLECIFDACWLVRNRAKLESFMGPEQHGGRADGVLLALSIITCLQLRTDAGLPAFLKKADLLQGFDLSWRDGCLYQLAQAGLGGRDWLLQDSAFSRDNFRIKLSHVVGPLCALTEFGIGQGKANSVHLFGVLTRGLADLYCTRALSSSMTKPCERLGCGSQALESHAVRGLQGAPWMSRGIIGGRGAEPCYA